MLTQPLLEKLTRLRLPGFREGLKEQWESPHYTELTFEERLSMLVDLECTRRDNINRKRRTKAARFGLPASIEDLDLSPARGLERSFILELAQGEWIRRNLHILVLEPTGAGKSYLACALGQAACRHGFSVRYHRTSRLLHETMLSHADGSFPKFLTSLARLPLLILDDWLRDPPTVSQTRDLLAEGPAPAGDHR
jgi:DNA replication protein DnaC